MKKIVWTFRCSSLYVDNLLQPSLRRRYADSRVSRRSFWAKWSLLFYPYAHLQLDSCRGCNVVSNLSLLYRYAEHRSSEAMGEKYYVLDIARGFWRHVSRGKVTAGGLRAYDGSYGSWSERADFIVGTLKVMTINPSAFKPVIPETECIYNKSGSSLIPAQDRDGLFKNEWLAPIVFPDKAKIDYVKFYYENYSVVASLHPTCHLLRTDTPIYDNYEIQASIEGTTALGNFDGTDSTIPDRVENDLYSYVILVFLPTTKNWLLGVEIGYWD